MTKEKLIDNLKKRMDDYGWSLDSAGVQNLVLTATEFDLNLLLESRENCGGPAEPKNIDFAAIT